MPHKLHHFTTRYLFTVWTIIITLGVVLSLFGIQRNFEDDYDRSRKADAALALTFCHAVADNNQAIRDILSLLSVNTKERADMTPSQLESIRVANARREGYRLIAEDLFANPKCSDGYAAASRKEELQPMLESTPTSTTSTPGAP